MKRDLLYCSVCDKQISKPNIYSHLKTRIHKLNNLLKQGGNFIDTIKSISQISSAVDDSKGDIYNIQHEDSTAKKIGAVASLVGNVSKGVGATANLTANLIAGKKKGAGFLDVLKNPISTIKQLIFGIDRFNYMSQETIKNNGDSKIIFMQVAKTPLNKVLESAVDALSFGKMESLKKEEGYDKLYHLSLIISLDNGEKIIYEKNETVYIQPLSNSNTLNNTTQYTNVSLWRNDLTLLLFIKNAQFRMKENYFTYMALHNNCQNFIMESLRASGLLTEELENFIYQDMTNIREELSKGTTSFFEPLINNITEVGARATILMGKGVKTKDKINAHLIKHTRIINKFIENERFKYI